MSSTFMHRHYAIIVAMVSWVLVSGSGYGADERHAGVIPVAIIDDVIYTWAIDPNSHIPGDDGVVLTTLAVTNISKDGAAKQQRLMPIDIWLYTQEDFKRLHRYPLRWVADKQGVQFVSFYFGDPKPAFVPTFSKAVRLRSELLASDPTKPTDRLDAKCGITRLEGRLMMGVSVDPPLGTDLASGFHAAYKGDSDREKLVTFQNSRDGRPPFTFDFSPPTTPNGSWTLYVQRAPLKTVDVISYFPDQLRDKRIAKVDHIPVPFSEPFFAHRTTDGATLFVTEQTGTIVSAKLLDVNAKEWQVQTLWSSKERPVRMLVRDGFDRVFAITDAEYFQLIGELKPRKHELGKFQSQSPVEMQKIALKAAKLVMSSR